MKRRESNIELLKVIAIILIVVSHITQTLTTKYLFINQGCENGFIELLPTYDAKIIALMLLRHLGAFANIIFVVCSSWFLLESKSNKKKKVFKLWGNMYVISVIILVLFLVCGYILPKKEIAMSLLPTIYENNWFITTYLLFILIVPYLNIIIEKMGQKELLRATLLMFVLYYVIAFTRNTFGVNFIIDFIVIYFVVAYSKKYMYEFWTKKKNSFFIIPISIILMIVLELGTNFLGIKYESISGKTLYWVKNNNPFFLMACIGIFFQVKKISFTNSVINRISSLSLYIYLIHDNLLIREYIRPKIWIFIYERFGYDLLFVKILIYAILLFLVSAIISFIYQNSIEKAVNKVLEKVYTKSRIRKIYDNFEGKIISIK